MLEEFLKVLMPVSGPFIIVIYRIFPHHSAVPQSPIDQFFYRRLLNATSTDDISMSSFFTLRLELVTCLAVTWALLCLAR
jgi:hypothetical protein